ncbi:hypothetical protein HK102_003196 [Quaeritorhiza haematococci]|nr:hypothetical protein HK102_003196 [Quaeritorhiza haematococci]
MAGKLNNQERELMQAFLSSTAQSDKLLLNHLEKEKQSLEHERQLLGRMHNFYIEEAHNTEENALEGTNVTQQNSFEATVVATQQKQETDHQVEEEVDQIMLNRIIRHLRYLKRKMRQEEEAGERVNLSRMRQKERRAAFQRRIGYLEVRHERERKELEDRHARAIKDILVKEKLDAVARNGGKTSSKRLGRNSKNREDSKAHMMEQGQIMALKIRHQKEMDQLNEFQLLESKQAAELYEENLEHNDAIEAMEIEQKVRLLDLDAENQKEYESEEERVQRGQSQLRIVHEQRTQAMKARMAAQEQKARARQLAAKQMQEAKQREQLQLEKEGLTTRDSNGNMSASGGSMLEGDGTTILEFNEGENAKNDEVIKSMMVQQKAELDEQIRKDSDRLVGLRARQKQTIQEITNKYNEHMRNVDREYTQRMRTIKDAHEAERKALLQQHTAEMNELMQAQQVLEKVEGEQGNNNMALYDLLPKYVADQIKSGVEDVEPKSFNSVTILEANIVNLTGLIAKSTPLQIVNLVNRLHTKFDGLAEKYADVYKLETIGDTYIVVGGLNNNQPQHHAYEICKFALDILKAVETIDMSDQAEKQIKIRIGIHTGSAVGAVLLGSTGASGVRMPPRFALYGKTLQQATELERMGRPNQIHIGAATRELVKDDERFACEAVEAEVASALQAEGGDKMASFWLRAKGGR